jgi:DNA end-binding protein Ku
MRPTWRGFVSFGLVTIPVKLYTATEEKDVRFRLLHTLCQMPIKNQRFCPHCEKVIEWADVVRGFEVSKGQFVTVTDEETEQIPIDTSGNVNIVGFVDLREIDPIYFERSYYMAPNEGGAKAFLLLQEALQDAGRVAVGKVVLREKEHLVAVRPYQGAMVMNVLYYADEVRALSGLEELPIRAEVHPNERKMAVQLVDNMAMEFHIEEFRDQYRAELLAMIDTKAKGMPVTAATPREPGKVIDLMEALRRSVEMAQSRRTTGRSGAGRESGETAEPRTGRPVGQQKRAAGGGLQERPR